MSDSTKLYDLTILTPNAIFASHKVQCVTVPSIAGAFQVLVNHAPIIATIDKGDVMVIDENHNKQRYQVKNGIAEFKNNLLTVNVATATTTND